MTTAPRLMLVQRTPKTSSSPKKEKLHVKRRKLSGGRLEYTLYLTRDCQPKIWAEKARKAVVEQEIKQRYADRRIVFYTEK